MHDEITTWMLSCLSIQIPIIMCSCLYIILKLEFRAAQGLETCAMGLESYSKNWLGISCFEKVYNHKFRFSHLHYGGKMMLHTGQQSSAKLFSRFSKCCKFWVLSGAESNAGSILMLGLSCSPLWNHSCALCLKGSNL